MSIKAANKGIELEYDDLDKLGKIRLKPFEDMLFNC